MRLTMTKSRIDVDPPKEKRRRQIDFWKLRPNRETGQVHSIHVLTAGERARIAVAFRYWAEHVAKIDAHAITKRVDETDPDGPGYRIWFMRGLREEASVEAEDKGDEI